MIHPWICPTEFSGDLMAIDIHTHINHGSPYSAAFQRGRIEFALIPGADKQKILRDNAMGLFSKNLA